MDEVSNSEFPVWALLPRRETGVVNHLSKYPEYDGRGTVIAIFDSGVDPAAPGLQVTTDGKVKVLDRIDATGAGDVDTSTVVKVQEDGTIKGVTNRTLKIPQSWNNPSGKYYIGTKSSYHLYPPKVTDRMIKDKKDNEWNPLHRKLLAEAADGYSIYQEKGRDHYEGAFVDRIERDNAEAKVALLQSLDKKYKDLGPTYDIIAFNDGEIWRVCIDTSECGELEKGILLGEYSKTHEHSFLTPQDQFTVSVNVYNDGKKVEIVGSCTSHGTHVASIAAAHFPDCPEKNGVSPGAQIVSIIIGDVRLNASETMTGISRAMYRCMKNPHYKVDVINMSYGEHCHSFKFGRFGEMASDVVNKYGVIWIASASNSGPALCTIGSPPNMKDESIIGVGAYVSPDMMAAEYSMLEKLPGCPYTWSSRGPTMDGARGVTICSPGGAITSVACFTLRKNQLMHGTSMSAPHAAGAFSLLVSGLKSKQIPYSPYSIRRSVENTALYLSNAEPYAQGHGLLQIDKAFEHVCKYSGCLEDMVRFNVECGSGGCKGIHLRNWDADKPSEIFINIEPVLLDEKAAEPKDKLAFEMEFVLTCDAPWVKCPNFLQMSYMSRSFKVNIDPAGMESGKVYQTSVKAFLAKQPDRGHMFEVPITIVKPIKELTNGYQYVSPSMVFKSGTISRTFIKVPLEATWANITLRAKNMEKYLKCNLHCLQMKPLSKFNTLDFYKMVDVTTKEPVTLSFCVKGGFTLEVCIARWWQSLQEGELEYSIDFRGITPEEQNICFVTGDQIHRTDVRAAFKKEEVSPYGVLKHFSQVVIPSDHKIEVLGGERDTVPVDRPIYQLILTYNFHLAKSDLEVCPKFMLLNDYLYESPFESQLYLIFDINKCFIYAGDAYADRYSVKMDKGDYVIRLHVRHEKLSLLESLTDSPITLVIKLPQDIKLDIYQSHNAASTSGKKVGLVNVVKGKVLPLYIATPNLTDKAFKGIGLTVGNTLLGTMAFSKDEYARKADVYPLKIFISDSKKKANDNNKKKDEFYKDYVDAIGDLQALWVSKLTSPCREKLLNELNEKESNYSPILLAQAQILYTETKFEEAIKLVDKVIDNIEDNELILFYGSKLDNRPTTSRTKTNMDKQKGWLLEALNKKGLCLLKKNITDDIELHDTNIRNVALRICKFVEANDSKVISFFIRFYMYNELYALAAKLVMKLLEDKYSKENEDKLIEIYQKLRWEHLVKHLNCSRPARFPKTYMPF